MEISKWRGEEVRSFIQNINPWHSEKLIGLFIFFRNIIHNTDAVFSGPELQSIQYNNSNLSSPIHECCKPFILFIHQPFISMGMGIHLRSVRPSWRPLTHVRTCQLYDHVVICSISVMYVVKRLVDVRACLDHEMVSDQIEARRSFAGKTETSRNKLNWKWK